MSDTYPLMKGVAVQTTTGVTQQQSLVDEATPLDVVLQNLLVADRNLMEILKGDIYELVQDIVKHVSDAITCEKIDNAVGFDILNECRKMNTYLRPYQRIIPYLILLSHLMRLTNIDQKEVASIKRRVRIMIRRDLLTMREDELKMNMINFLDAVQILIFNGINDSFNGWKAKVVTEQKRTIRQELVEQPTRKKRLGIF